MNRSDIDILSRGNVSEGTFLTGFMALMFYDWVRRPVEASRTQCGANKARSCVYSRGECCDAFAPDDSL